MAAMYSALLYLGVHLVICPGQHDLPRLSEATKVVHVAIDDSIITADPPPEPNDLLEAQIVLQEYFDLLAHVHLRLVCTFVDGLLSLVDWLALNGQLL